MSKSKYSTVYGALLIFLCLGYTAAVLLAISVVSVQGYSQGDSLSETLFGSLLTGAVLLSVPSFVVYRQLRRYFLYQKRPAIFEALMVEMKPKQFMAGGAANWLQADRARNFVGYRGYTITNRRLFADFGNWLYSEFELFRENKNQKFQTRKVLSVAQLNLPREMPHIIFDSRHAFGDRAKRQIDRVHRLHLHPELEEHFTIYSPINYEIDTLSFITPEVIEILLDAKNYDIEILGRQIFLYSPLRPLKAQLSGTERIVRSLEHRFIDNLDTYRDARVSASGSGERTISAGALRLNKSRRAQLFGISATSLFLLGSLIAITLYLPGLLKNSGVNVPRLLMSILSALCITVFVLKTQIKIYLKNKANIEYKKNKVDR